MVNLSKLPLVFQRIEEAQTLHRPSGSGTAQGVDGSTASTIHANNQVGSVPGAAPWHKAILALLLILNMC